MKIVHVLPTPSSSYGGPVAVANQLARVATASGHEVCVLPEKALPPLRLGRTLVYRLGREEVSQLISRTKEADILHVHGLWNLPCTAACHIARRSSTPYIVTPHGMLARWSLVQSRFKKQIYGLLAERRNLSGAAAIHFLNESEREEGLAYGLSAPTFVLANGIDSSLLRLERTRNGLDSLVPASRDRTTVLFLGRLHYKKGLDRLLPAFAAARRVQANLHLIIAGPDDDGYGSRVRRLVDRLGLSASVTLLGEVRGSRKTALLSGADIFALISREEGDPVAVKEAMAAGMPVVISDRCRLPAIADTGAGVVVQPDVESVSRALIRFAGDAGRRATAGAAGREWIRRHCESTDVGRRMLAAYARFGFGSAG